MGSLFKLLFDTMPFAGLAGVLSAKSPNSTLIQHLETDYGAHLRYIPPTSPEGLKYRSDDATGRANEEEDESVVDQIVQQLKGEPDESEQSKILQKARRTRPLWAFDASLGSVNSTVQGISCQVSGDSFNRYKVLSNLRFGNDFNGTFENAIQVAYVTEDKKTFACKLRLTESACLANFIVRNGLNPKNGHALWPLPAVHDAALLRVYVFDVSLLAGVADALAEAGESHPDAAELKKFRAACEIFGDRGKRLAPVGQQLFADNLWRAAAPSAPIATVGGAHDLGVAVMLSAVRARVLVCTSLTLHKEDDTFTPGRPAWSARLYPHIMVRSTLPLARVDAGVKFERPSETTLDGPAKQAQPVDGPDTHGGIMGCHEMNKDISTILVADANVDNMLYDDLPGNAPQPFWNSVFNYYVANAARNKNITAGAIKVVDRLKVKKRQFDKALVRYDDSNGRVTRFPRQGAFDNIHVAPTMRAPKVTSVMKRSRLIPTLPITIDDREAWHLNDIAMAPICAHDCFHMHWRWTDNITATDASSMGYGGGSYHVAKGATMVAENQDVFLRILTDSSFSYYACAYEAPADEWTVICHHGTTYITEVKKAVDLGRGAMSMDPGVQISGDPAGFSNGPVPVTAANWSIFYWNCRWHIDGEEPVDRVQIQNWDQIMNEQQARGAGKH